MDFIAMADLHLTTERPRSRKGNYKKQILNKFEQILKLTKKKTKSNLLIIAGDFFDSPQPSQIPYSLTYEVMDLIKKHNVTIFAVPGQHDLRYHTKGLKNTPLGNLQAAGYVKILNGKEKTFHDIIPEYSFVGQGWNEQVTVENADVLVTHRMVIKNKLWKDQKEYITANQILKKHKGFSYIISGDNHLPHFLKKKNQFQINCGSVTRKNKLQIDYQPCVWKIDLENKRVTKIKIKVKPKNFVFDFDKIERSEKEEEVRKKKEQQALNNIPLFIKQIFDEDENNTKEASYSFPVVLKRIIDEVKPKEEVKQIINNTMEKL